MKFYPTRDQFTLQMPNDIGTLSVSADKVFKMKYRHCPEMNIS